MASLDGDEQAGTAFAAGVERWPGVHVERERFVSFFTERAGRATSVDGPGLYLACACTAGDPVAVRAFHDQFMADIDIALARLHYTGARADELRSAVLEKLAPADVELSHLEAHYRGAFRDAFGKAIARLDPQQRAMLRHRWMR